MSSWSLPTHLVLWWPLTLPNSYGATPMCHPPLPSFCVTLLLIFGLENRIFKHIRYCHSCLLKTKDTFYSKKGYCSHSDTLFPTYALHILTVNNWGLHNNPRATEYCQMFPLHPLLFFLFLEPNVFQVMTGLKSVRSERCSVLFN